MRALIIVCCLLFAVGAVGTPALAAEQITADPAVVTLVNKSTELIKAGKKAEAIAELEKALTHKLAPQAESNVLTRLAIMLSEDPKAFDYLTRARQLDPKNTLVFLPLAQHYLLRKEYDKGIDALKQFLAAEPNGPGAATAARILNVAEAYVMYDRGQFQECLTRLQKCQSEDPSDKNVVLRMALCYEGMNNLKETIETLKKYSKMDLKPDEAESIRKRINALEKVVATGDEPSTPDYVKGISDPCFVRWAPERTELKVFVEDGSSVAGYQSFYANSVTEAMNEWTQASGGKFTLVPVKKRGDANITIDWISDPKEFGLANEADPEGECLTAAQRYGKAKVAEITEAHIKFLTKREEAAHTPDTFRRVALHELGHALGLRGHSSCNNDIMYFSAQKHKDGQGLTARDKSTLAVLYTKSLDAATARAAGGAYTTGAPHFKWQQHMRQGRQHRLSIEYKEAEQAYRLAEEEAKSLGLDAQFMTYGELAELQEEIGDYAKALESRKKQRAGFPSASMAPEVEILQKQGKFDEARAVQEQDISRQRRGVPNMDSFRANLHNDINKTWKPPRRFESQYSVVRFLVHPEADKSFCYIADPSSDQGFENAVVAAVDHVKALGPSGAIDPEMTGFTFDVSVRNPDYVGKKGALDPYSAEGQRRRRDYQVARGRLKWQEQTLGNDHIEVAASLLDAGEQLADIGNKDASEAAYMAAAEIFVRNKAECNTARKVFRALGQAAAAKGNMPHAEAYFKHALELSQKIFIPESPLISQSKEDLATMTATGPKSKN